ncbi:MAG: Spy/CpxP family protein refolding chaperone [Thermodesulfobacteriota bacterium]
MKKVTLTVMAVLFVAAVATSVFAFGWGRGPGYGPCGRGDFEGQAGLNLAPEQTAKFKEMREAQWKEMKPLREQMFTKRDEIRKLWLEPNPDQEKIAAAQKEMRSLRDQIQDKMTAIRLEALKTLTPEQQDKIRSSFSERGFDPRRGMGPGGCGGGMMGPGGWHGGMMEPGGNY